MSMNASCSTAAWLTYQELDRENCPTHSEQFLIANSFPARIGTSCPPPLSLLRFGSVCGNTGLVHAFTIFVSSGGQKQKLLLYGLLKTNGTHMRLKLLT